MLVHFIKGALLGFTVAFIIGPVFFTLIQTSIYRGFRAGVQLAFGVVLSDLFLIMLSYVGLLQLLNNGQNYFIVGSVGGVLLIFIGLVTAMRAPSLDKKTANATIIVKKPGAATYITKGFIMNVLNPFLLIFWITIMSIHTVKEDVVKSEIIVFFTGTLFTIFLTDVVKCYVAKKLKRFITERILLLINRGVGVLLIAFGLVLIFRVIFLSDFF